MKYNLCISILYISEKSKSEKYSLTERNLTSVCFTDG